MWMPTSNPFRLVHYPTQKVQNFRLGPYCVGVRENWYAGERGSLKTGKRCRNVPITPELAEELEAYVAGRGKFTAPEDPLFVSRTGTPIDSHNMANRTFKPLTLKLGFPVTWYGFRRAHSTFVGQLDNISVEDRRATMGHADAEMSLYYSLSDVERRRAIPRQILERLKSEAERAEEVVDVKVQKSGTFCDYCERQIPEGSRFCNHCGKKVAPAAGA
jgi:hypothetical protein